MPLELWLLVPFSAAVIWLPFHGYWIIWVYCVCLCQDEFRTLLIIVATSWFCSGLTLFVVTEAAVLAVLFFFLRRSFPGCYLAGSIIIRCWVSQISRNHSSLLYHLVGYLISKSSSTLFIFNLNLPPRPPRPPLLRPPLPSKGAPLPPFLLLPYELTCRFHPYLTGDEWVSGESCDITVDMYVEYVSKLALWLYLQILTSFFKTLFWKLMLSYSFLTLSSLYRRTLQFSITLNICFI